MRWGLLAVLLTLQLFHTSAEAELLPIFDFETAETLPKGVLSPRFRTMVIGISQSFDDTGNSRALAAPFNRQVKWSDVLSAQPNEADKESLRSLLNTGKPLREDGIAGNVKAEVNNVMQVAVPILLVGVTDKLLLGVGVPIVRVDSQADTGFEKSDEGQELINRACTSSSPVKCGEAAGRLNRALQEKLTSLGYEPIRSQTFTSIGDVRLLAKYSLLNTGTTQLTLKPLLTLPTGKIASPDDVLGLKTGEGRYTLTMIGVLDRRDLVVPGLKLNLFAGYSAQLPDSAELRIPTRESNISGDKERVSRGLTSGAFAGTSLLYTMSRIGIAVGAGYNFQYASSTTFTGSRFDPDRYVRLKEINPSRTLHNGTLLAGFTSIDWYRKQRFPVPLELNFSYSKSLGGTNNWNSDIYAAELILFL